MSSLSLCPSVCVCVSTLGTDCFLSLTITLAITFSFFSFFFEGDDVLSSLTALTRLHGERESRERGERERAEPVFLFSPLSLLSSPQKSLRSLYLYF